MKITAKKGPGMHINMNGKITPTSIPTLTHDLLYLISRNDF